MRHPRQEHGVWDGRGGRAADAARRGAGCGLAGRRWAVRRVPTARGRDPRPGAGTGRGGGRPTARRRRAVAVHGTRVAAGRPGLLAAGRAARRPARVRRTARTDQRLRRHGRRRHHVLAGAGQQRTQLRLPLRVAPRPCYAGLAVAAHGPHPLVDDAVRFVAERILEDGGTRSVSAYTVDGLPVGGERLAAAARLSRRHRPCRQRRGTQFQLDTPGEALQFPRRAAAHDRLIEDERPAPPSRWTSWSGSMKPDAGLWELRTAVDPLAAERGVRSAADGGGAARDGGAVLQNAARRHRVVGDPAPVPGRPRPLAAGRRRRRAEAALLEPMARGCAFGDDDGAATRAYIESRLAEDGYLYRFEHPVEPPGDAEGAFLLCGFTMALATHRSGSTNAFRWFERTRAACGLPGVVRRGVRRAPAAAARQSPAGLVHAMMLECAGRPADESALPRPLGRPPRSIRAGRPPRGSLRRAAARPGSGVAPAVQPGGSRPSRTRRLRSCHARGAPAADRRPTSTAAPATPLPRQSPRPGPSEAAVPSQARRSPPPDLGWSAVPSQAR
ncbi:glycoside hydrolase family 15 protein [Streptomyces thinghirensis]|nr:glycoside hydrolase family 15 protein [Streptomyces thinghirensis]